MDDRNSIARFVGTVVVTGGIVCLAMALVTSFKTQRITIEEGTKIAEPFPEVKESDTALYRVKITDVRSVKDGVSEDEFVENYKNAKPGDRYVWEVVRNTDAGVDFKLVREK